MKEMKGLNDMECFRVMDQNWKPGTEYQYAPLRMIFDVKSDLRRKSRLVAGGHVVDAGELPSYASTVKGVSIRLLFTLAHSRKLKVMVGDIGQAYINAYTPEKIWTRAGPEFGPSIEGRKILIQKALYGLSTSANAFHKHLSDSLRSLGFVPTKYDRDVWYCKNEAGDGYDYIARHVDDLICFSDDPSKYMTKLSEKYNLRDVKVPDEYLGCTIRDRNGYIHLDGSKYIKESVRRIETHFDKKLRKHNTPIPDDHPELDETPLLDDKGTRDYQMLIGMAQWLVVLCRIDICFAVSSLSRFSSAPREGHLRRAFQLWGYLSKFKNKGITINSRAPTLGKDVEQKLSKKDFEEQYPDAAEELPSGLPEPLGEPLETNIMFDSDHAHDQKSRRSITGMLSFVGCTPIVWLSKRQGAVATSTYAAEFSAMRTSTEEAVSLRYMLRCLGVPVTEPTVLWGDNLGVIQSATNPEADLKKKHVALSFHFTREMIAAEVTEARHVPGEHNQSDLATKVLPAKTFHYHTQDVNQ